MNARRTPNLTTKLAATLLALGDIPWEDAKLMSAAQIVSLYEFDHWPIRHEAGGPAAAWNLKPRLIMFHRIKSRKDQSEIAHIRRVRRANDAHVNRLLAKDRGEPKPRSRWPSRPFPKRQKKLRRR